LTGFADKFNIKLNRNEISGSLGDLGTFLPLATGLVIQCGMDLGHLLLWAGLAYVAAGLVFKIPMPVQPMKIIAAVAIAEGLDVDTITAAGLVIGAVMIFLAAVKLIDWLNGIIPRSVVRGLQLAVGLKLMFKGLDFAYSSGFNLVFDSIYMAIICFFLILLFFKFDKWPGALIIFLIGLAIALFGIQGQLSGLTLGGSLPSLQFPALAKFKYGFLNMTLPQIPLTILNSVIAVCLLSRDFFPSNPLPPAKVSISVGLMNLIACPLGGMPMCHGAGGLASHYRFGARTAGSVIFLGSCMLLLALLFGNSLVAIFTAYPAAVLGMLLLFSGWQLVYVCKDMKAVPDISVMIITAGFCLYPGVVYGFLIGFFVALIMKRLNLNGKRGKK
jgi:MFS superfamily sulfate permease-like transporter